MRLNLCLFVGMTAVAAAGVAHSGTIVFKCIKDGQTVLTDRSCPSVPLDSTGPTTTPSDSVLSVSSPSFSPVGKWGEQVQYQANVSGQVLQAAHTVVPLVTEFTPDGRLSGNSKENACKLLGIWSQDPRHIVWLDVTLTACRFSGLNRRFNGSFLLAKPTSSGLLQIMATDLPHAGQGARMYDIKGTLRR
jgi:hypothetical protein